MIGTSLEILFANSKNIRLGMTQDEYLICKITRVAPPRGTCFRVQSLEIEVMIEREKALRDTNP